MIAVMISTTSPAAMLVSSVTAAVLSRGTFMHGGSPTANSRTLYSPTNITVLARQREHAGEPKRGTRVGPHLKPLHAVSLRPDGPTDYVDRHRQRVHAHEIEHVLEHARLHRGPGAHRDGPERQQAAALAEHDAADGCRDRADGGDRHEVAHVDRAGARELSGDRRPLLRWLEQQAFCPGEPARELACGSRFRRRCFDRGPGRGGGPRWRRPPGL